MSTGLMRGIEIEDRLRGEAARCVPPIPLEAVNMHIQLLESERKKRFEAAVSVWAGVLLQTMEMKGDSNAKK